MNEVQIQTNNPDPAPDVFEALPSVSGGDVLFPSGAAPESSDLFGHDGLFSDLVSGYDMESLYPGQEVLSTEPVAVQDLSTDIAPYLQKIDYTLTAILFFMVFRFCFERIRSGVKGFTGRGIDI